MPGRPRHAAGGPRSVFAKALLDSRRAILAAGIGIGVILYVTASQLAVQFPTSADRLVLAAQSANLPPAIRGLLGQPINVDRLGGFLSWRTINSMPIIVGLWSIAAMAGTLGGEARSGSLDLLASTPLSRTRIAVEKIAAHVVGLSLAMAITAVIVWIAGLQFAVLPGDRMALTDSLAHFAYVGLVGLVAGAIAFAAAAFLGRSAGAGVGAIALFTAYLANSYGDLIAAFGRLRPLSWFAWTAGHRPLAGVTDWPSLVGPVLLVIGFFALGVAAFGRRDLGSYVALPRVPVPAFVAGLGGPTRRAFAERLPAALAWGAAIGLYGLLVGTSARSFAALFSQIPQVGAILDRFYPGVDWHAPAGVLQLAFFDSALLAVGLAAAGIVGGATSDEREGRTDLLLATPLSRARFALSAGVGAMTAIGLMVVVIASVTTAGILAVGQAVDAAFVGTLVLGLYGVALAGAGFAVAGLLRPGWAGPLIAGLAVGSYLLVLIGRPLRLPQVILDLALNSHYGQPMAGIFDGLGIIASALLAVGGLALGAWGLGRRDLNN